MRNVPDKFCTEYQITLYAFYNIFPKYRDVYEIMLIIL